MLQPYILTCMYTMTTCACLCVCRGFESILHSKQEEEEIDQDMCIEGEKAGESMEVEQPCNKEQINYLVSYCKYSDSYSGLSLIQTPLLRNLEF